MKININPGQSADEFTELSRFANLMPAPLFWLDLNGVVLGMNNAAAYTHGNTTRVLDKVIGKRHSDFYPEHIAKFLDENNQKVIDTGETIAFDEKVVSVTTGNTIDFASVRSPWCDKEGNIIGIIGTSIDITDTKEKERLQLELQHKLYLLEEQENFRRVVNNVAHDIRSPLASLSVMLEVCDNIPEKERLSLRHAVTRINDVANHLLSTYTQREELQPYGIEEAEPILLSPMILQMLTEKKYQYQHMAIKFDQHFSQPGKFSWVQLQPIAFKIMISNLINNAVDAFEQGIGKVTVYLDANAEQVTLTVADNGKGMIPELVEKLLHYKDIPEGTDSGLGLGLSQVMETLKNNQGQWRIESTLGLGTKIKLSFPRVQPLSWMAENITLNQDDTVLILDDDSSIHMAWDMRFEKILKLHPTLTVWHFEKGQDVLDFMDSIHPDQKATIFLLTDYELLKQSLNGLDVIELASIQRSLIVTSHFTNRVLQKSAISVGTKILPKQLAPDIPIRII